MSHDTIAINRELHRFDGHSEVWLFGYGSLIWKCDFPFLERRPAHVRDWARRFWQGSHDHRGTPDAPGRVVTLIPSPGTRCAGMAYLITPEVFDHLDHREKNGYLRETVRIEFGASESVNGLVYIANPENAAFLGDASIQRIARQILSAQGPSGLNLDYFQHLLDALRQLGETDSHLDEIALEMSRIRSNA